ncbi:MAG: hypothetical protein F4024_00500 [Gammaproteobacteria bacterium]|nr:hypothetical protein [Gammaproteobacteria bacterium]
MNFVDFDGRSVEVTKAELLLVAWGETQRIELETSANSLQLVLEPDWLRSRWQAFDEQEAVFLYLEAPPLAPIRSNRFRWPVVTGYGIPTVISFPGGQQVVIKDLDASMTLAFRPTAVRRVHVVTSRGNPLPEVEVAAYRFWSDYNRCAHLSGGDRLGTFVTDADGLLEVPDGDFEYVLSLGRFTHEFVDGDRRVPWRLRTHLREATTEVRAREFAVEPLEMRVVRGDKPAPGVHLLGHLASCHCGACHGPLGTADETGWIRVDDYRPGLYNRIWLVDEGETVWDSNRDPWPESLEVRISPARSVAR